MIALDPLRLTRCAGDLLAWSERHGGPALIVNAMLEEVGALSGAHWSAAFVHHVGYWSHYDSTTRSSTWPLPATASCEQLARFAAKAGMLRKTPRAGDVVLVSSALPGDFFQTGVIVRVIGGTRSDRPFRTLYRCETIEGDSRLSRRAPHGTLRRRQRELCPQEGDRTIRWYDVEAQHSLVAPAPPTTLPLALA